jgi:hypothetical protein
MGDTGENQSRDAEVLRSVAPSDGPRAVLDALGFWQRPILATLGDEGREARARP